MVVPGGVRDLLRPCRRLARVVVAVVVTLASPYVVVLVVVEVVTSVYPGGLYGRMSGGIGSIGGSALSGAAETASVPGVPNRADSVRGSNLSEDSESRSMMATMWQFVFVLPQSVSIWFSYWYKQTHKIDNIAQPHAEVNRV